MIEKLTVIAADIDGTLALKGGNLMPKTRAALQRIHEEGVLFGIASGRPMDRRIINISEMWNLGFGFDFAIGMNGGELWDRRTDKVEKYYPIRSEQIREILTFLDGLDLNAICYQKGYDLIYALRMDDFLRDSQKRNRSIVEIGDIDKLSENDTGKIEVHLKRKDLDEFLRRVEENKNPLWQCVNTFTMEDHVTMEFQDPRVNKGVALTKYAERYDIPMEEVMAFGDMHNDLTLLDTAGWGVCLLNGCDECKAVSQAITDYDVHHDGVGHYLEDHWFNR